MYPPRLRVDLRPGVAGQDKTKPRFCLFVVDFLFTLGIFGLLGFLFVLTFIFENQNFHKLVRVRVSIFFLFCFVFKRWNIKLSASGDGKDLEGAGGEKDMIKIYWKMLSKKILKIIKR